MKKRNNLEICFFIGAQMKLQRSDSFDSLSRNDRRRALGETVG